MIQATVSPSAGYCIIDRDNAVPSLIMLSEMAEVDASIHQPMLAIVDDWQVLTGDNRESVIRNAQHLSQLTQCVSLVRLSLMIANNDIALPIYEEIENLLSAEISSGDVLHRLIVAPHKNADRILECSKQALSHGYAATGNLFHRFFDIQPLLRKVAHAWLSIPVDHFYNAGRTKEEWWSSLIEPGYLLRIVEANDSGAVRNVFGLIAFDLAVPREREVAAKLGSDLSGKLFGSEEIEIVPEDVYSEPNEHTHHQDEGFWKDNLDRALSEISGIVHAVATGDEYHAEKYLRDLIDRQTSSQEDHVIKSLCNLAQQCADMFRTDFEALCLQKALEITPNDSWTLIQYGDHLKRRGLYDKAIEIVEQAISYGDEKIGYSMLADITAQQGDYELSIEEYKSISGWNEEPAIRTAIADNLRRLGQFDAAIAEYDQIDIDGLGSERTSIGRAEIKKIQGHLDEAISIYRNVLSRKGLEQRQWIRFRIALAGALKQNQDFETAITEIEDVIQMAPYSMEARVLRSSLWGLLDKAEKGLNQLPSIVTSAFREWLNGYTRGLLLLRTNNYKEAQKNLVSNLDSSVLEDNERDVLRLAASLAFIANNNYEEAKQYIVVEASAHDSYLNYLSKVLDYHISIIENNTEKASLLFKQLEDNMNNNIILWEAVKALKHGDTETAVKIEVDAFLRFAA